LSVKGCRVKAAGDGVPTPGFAPKTMHKSPIDRAGFDTGAWGRGMGRLGLACDQDRFDEMLGYRLGDELISIFVGTLGEFNHAAISAEVVLTLLAHL